MGPMTRPAVFYGTMNGIHVKHCAPRPWLRHPGVNKGWCHTNIKQRSVWCTQQPVQHAVRLPHQPGTINYTPTTPVVPTCTTMVIPGA
jgi:hypothetical protein